MGAPRHLELGVAELLKHASPICFTVPNLIAVCQTAWVSAVHRQDWAPAFRFSPTLKIIGTNADRSDNYDFWLTFHRNHGIIASTVISKMKRDIGRKLRFFFWIHVYLTLRWRVSLECVKVPGVIEWWDWPRKGLMNVSYEAIYFSVIRGGFKEKGLVGH